MEAAASGCDSPDSGKLALQQTSAPVIRQTLAPAQTRWAGQGIIEFSGGIHLQARRLVWNVHPAGARQSAQSCKQRNGSDDDELVPLHGSLLDHGFSRRF